MSMVQHNQEGELQRAFSEDGTSSGNWRNLAHSQDESDDSNSLRGFECNICLDLVQDPVVTFCGHLYCWPCIYRWIRNPLHQKPQCPVCKTEVSQSTIIPIYGRGELTKTSSIDEVSHVIPQRPRCGGSTMFVPSPAQALWMYNAGNYMAYRGRSTGSGSPMVDPMMGVFGEMIFAGIFGNSDGARRSMSGGGTRRDMLESDRSLSRVCFFLCCCAILCLLLF